MKNQPEGPKNYSPEEMSELMKSRNKSDIELVEEGAKYKFNNAGQGGLELTKNQIKEANKYNDKDTILKALREGKFSNDDMWELAPDMCTNKEVILEAIKQHLSVAFIVSRVPNNKLWRDKDFVIKALELDEHAGYGLPDEVIDEEIALAVVKRHPFYLQNFSSEMKGNKNVVLAAIKEIIKKYSSMDNGFFLRVVSKDLQQDPEVRKAAGLK